MGIVKSSSRMLMVIEVYGHQHMNLSRTDFINGVPPNHKIMIAENVGTYFCPLKAGWSLVHL